MNCFDTNLRGSLCYSKKIPLSGLAMNVQGHDTRQFQLNVPCYSSAMISYFIPGADLAVISRLSTAISDFVWLCLV